MSPPDFLIVGAMKAGTTMLADVCRMHGGVFIPRAKELHYFDRNWRRGSEWYRAQFRDAKPGQVTGEATPLYMYDPATRERMLRALPSALYVAILRDPVSRAYAHYWHERRKGRETRTFVEALAAEEARLESDDMSVRAHASYVDRGRYAGQLESLAQHLDPEQLLVMILEEVLADPQGQFDKLFDFLGVPSLEVPTPLPRSNPWRPSGRSAMGSRIARRMRPSWFSRSIPSFDAYPPIASDLRGQLAALYVEDNARLARVFGGNISSWSTP